MSNYFEPSQAVAEEMLRTGMTDPEQLVAKQDWSPNQKREFVDKARQHMPEAVVAVAPALAEQWGLSPERAVSMARRVRDTGGDFEIALARELRGEVQVSEAGLRQWGNENPEGIKALAGMKKPSRKQFAELGLPRRSAAERQEAAATARAVMLQPLGVVEDVSTEGTGLKEEGKYGHTPESRSAIQQAAVVTYKRFFSDREEARAEESQRESRLEEVFSKVGNVRKYARQRARQQGDITKAPAILRKRANVLKMNSEDRSVLLAEADRMESQIQEEVENPRVPGIAPAANVGLMSQAFRDLDLKEYEFELNDPSRWHEQGQLGAGELASRAVETKPKSVNWLRLLVDPQRKKMIANRVDRLLSMGDEPYPEREADEEIAARAALWAMEQEYRGKDWLAQVSEGVDETVRWMQVMMVTGGAYSSAKGSASGLVQHLTKRYGTNLVTRAMSGLGGRVAGAAVQGALNPRMIEDMVDRQMPAIMADKTGELIIEPSESSMLTDITRTYVSSFIQTFSEHVGDDLMAGLSFAAKNTAKLTGKLIKKNTLAKASSAARKLLNKIPKGKAAQQFYRSVEKLYRQGAFTNPIGERMEEDLGDFLETLAGTHDEEELNQNFAAFWQRRTDPEQSLIELAVLFTPWAAKTGVKYAPGIGKKLSKHLRDPLDALPLSTTLPAGSEIIDIEDAAEGAWVVTYRLSEEQYEQEVSQAELDVAAREFADETPSDLARQYAEAAEAMAAEPTAEEAVEQIQETGSVSPVEVTEEVADKKAEASPATQEVAEEVTEETHTPTATGSQRKQDESAVATQGATQDEAKAADEQLTYEQFSQAYREAFEQSNKYTPDQAGSNIYTSKMADLADKYPEFLERFEQEVEAADKAMRDAEATPEQAQATETTQESSSEAEATQGPSSGSSETTEASIPAEIDIVDPKDPRQYTKAPMPAVGTKGTVKVGNQTYPAEVVGVSEVKAPTSRDPGRTLTIKKPSAAVSTEVSEAGEASGVKFTKAKIIPTREDVKAVPVEEGTTSAAALEESPGSLRDELNTMDEAEMDALFAEVEAKQSAGADSDVVTGSQQQGGVENIIAGGYKPKKKSVRKRKAGTKKRGKKSNDAAQAALASAAKHGVAAAGEAIQGLADLFGGANRMGVGWSDETYAKAKPHFEAALKEFSAAGNSLKDFVSWAVNNFGAGIRPYLQQFRRDLAAESQGATDGRDSGRKSTGARTDDEASGAGASATRSDDATNAGDAPGATETDAGADSDLQPAQSDDGGSSDGDGVLPSSVGVAEQPTAGADSAGGESEAIRPGDNGVVPTATGAGDTDAAGAESSVVGPGKSGRGNYNLHDKPPVRLSRRQRREINERAKAILQKPAGAITDEDRNILRQYTGEGGLSSGTREALNQHYTSYQVVRQIFRTLNEAGVELKRLLEPGVGSGNFVGHVPTADWTTVDIDKTNHQVVSALYPNAKHYNISFEEFTESGFDAVICNVPFLEIRGAGRSKARPDIKALHDFYFVHSLDRVKDDGVIAFVTSTGTMDKLNSSIRKEIVSKADVIGAFRLPGETFAENAHTDVTTDVIFLQKRPVGVEARPESVAQNEAFVESTKTADNIALNNYYQQNPEAILGTLIAGKNKRYGGRPAYEVHGPANLDDMIIDYRPYGSQKEAAAEGEAGGQDDVPTKAAEFLAWARDRGVKVRTSDSGHYAENILVEDGAVYVTKAEIEFSDINRSGKTYEKLADENTAKILALRQIADLATGYQAGNDMAAAEGISAIKSYQDRFKTNPHADRTLKQFFRDFGEMALYAELVAGLNRDFSPADVFFERTRHKGSGRIRATEDDSLKQQAIAAEDNQGRIIFPTEQGFVVEGDATTLLASGYALAGYENGSPELQNDILYYSGNIYKKIAAIGKMMREAPGEFKPFLEDQRSRLMDVRPEPKPFADINIKGNEDWLTPWYSKLGIRIKSMVDKKTGVRKWSVDGFSFGLTADEEKVLTKYLNNHQLTSRKSVNKIPESMGTFMRRMREKEDVLRSALGKLRRRITENEGTLEAIEDAFNSRYRSYVKPDYAKAQYLIQDVLDEVAENAPTMRDPKTGKPVPFRFRRNQIAWAVQALYEGRGINAHDVGGGKTISAILLARALKRRGRAQKPMFLVPAKTIKKWVKETKLLFPNAKVIDLGNLAREKRQQALFDLANTNADYVFISHEGFRQIQLPAEIEADYAQAILNEHVDDPEASGRQAGKIQEQMDAYRQALLNDGRDTRLTWDKLGIDCLVADEAHNFKNIGVSNQMKEYHLGDPLQFTKSGKLKSSRSYDFRFKANYTTDNNNGNNVFLLTATPTPNKPMEVYTILRHLGADIFKDYGIRRDRDFAGQFFYLGTVQDHRGAPKKVLRAIINAQELRGLLNRYVDKMNMEEMPWITVPEARERRVLLDQSDAYAMVSDDLTGRQSALTPPPHEEGDDTLIAIYTGGRSASVDPRLYGGEHANVEIDTRSFDEIDDKLEWTINTVAKQAEDDSGSGQLIFLDDSGHSQTARGVLAENLHREMKRELMKKGLPAAQIAIINGKEITNPATGKETSPGSKADARKAELQDAYNDGKIKVMIGSTSSMGEGMDLQRTTTDIYHLDIPYTPGEIRQRNGRGVRPGNRNDSVRVHYLLMRGSFDSLSLNIVQTKRGWNEALWDKEVANTISTEEEMAAGVIPSSRQILIELERDPIRRKQMEVEFKRDSMLQQIGAWRDELNALDTREWTINRYIQGVSSTLASREKKLAELVPDETIKDEAKQAEKFEISKKYAARMVEASKKHIAEARERLEAVLKKQHDINAQVETLREEVKALEARWYDDNGEIVVTPGDLEEQDSESFGKTMDFPAMAAMASAKTIPGSDSVTTGHMKPRNLVNAADVVAATKRLWPELSIRGRGTFKKKAPGWYNTDLGEMRVKDIRDLDVIAHELGHHFDRQLDMWSKSRKLPAGVGQELTRLGKELYGDKRPRGGYRAEGFAEFVRRYLAGEVDLDLTVPALYDWFATSYLAGDPAEAKKIRQLQDMIFRLQARTPEQAVRAFRQPAHRDWSVNRIVANVMASAEDDFIDINLPILRVMQETGADLGSLAPDQHTYMLLTYYSRSGGGRAAHAALAETTDLYGRHTGDGLRQVLAPIAEAGQVEEWTDYAVASMALLREAQGKQSGLSPSVARAVVKKYQSEMFDQVLRDVTNWNHRLLKLLVDAGAMTQEEYDSIIEANPIYIPMFRQFEENDNRKKGRKSRGVYRFKGSGREIHNPIDSMVAQAERIIVTAMQADVMRSLVRFYDSQKGKVEALGQLMSEVPSPTKSTTFMAEQIKKEMVARAVELGADAEEAEVRAASETWSDAITVWTRSSEYRGQDNIISLDIDGTRRWFEVNDKLMPIMQGMARKHVLGGKLGAISRQAVGLQRLGATGLNASFGLVRNLIRDTFTAFLQAEYHFHVPFLSTLHGVVLDLVNSADAKRYHAAGLDLASYVGQDLQSPSVRRMSRRATAGNLWSQAWRAGILTGLREILSHSEVGPRLMEFRGAYRSGMSKWGREEAALVLAGCAAKDVTTNFSRAGSTGRAVNEVVLFFNAAIQSIDKFGRALGLRAPMPWAKEQSRLKTAARTIAKAAIGLTLPALLNYLRNRDEEWWQELPPHEKWSYIHVRIGDTIIRLPLPFEHGAVFGALPIAALEESRTPGTFKETVDQVLAANTPIDVSSLHGLASNIALLSPLADVVANEDWTGRPIVPAQMLEHREPVDQYTPHTTWLPREIGKRIGYSPARIEHLLNQYTGNLYRRTADSIAALADPSDVKPVDTPSSIPIFGTLFLRPGTSRVANDFYQRLGELTQKAGSGNASLAEMGELFASRQLSRKLSPLWSKRRAAVTSNRTAGEIAEYSQKVLATIQEKIRKHQDSTAKEWRDVGLAALSYSATDPNADDDDTATALRLFSGLSDDEVFDAFRREAKRRGLKTEMWSRAHGRPARATAFGRRMIRLRQILENSSPP